MNVSEIEGHNKRERPLGRWKDRGKKFIRKIEDHSKRERPLEE